MQPSPWPYASSDGDRTVAITAPSWGQGEDSEERQFFFSNKGNVFPSGFNFFPDSRESSIFFRQYNIFPLRFNFFPDSLKRLVYY